jgi:uncharacterized CHY-type Zn-finger protein
MSQTLRNIAPRKYLCAQESQNISDKPYQIGFTPTLTTSMRMILCAVCRQVTRRHEYSIFMKNTELQNTQQ